MPQPAIDDTHDTIFYTVRPGDSLSAIIKRYHGPVSLPQQNRIIDKIKQDNPQLTNPNLIYPGQALIIDIPQKYVCMAPGQRPVLTLKGDKEQIRDLQNAWQTGSAEEKALLSSLAPLMLGSGTASLMMIDKTFKTNAPLVGELVENYNDYQARRKTKGQYDYRRRTILSRLQTNLGPTNLLLNGTRSPNEVLRISRRRGVAPTEPLERQTRKMRSVARLARNSGVVLSVAGLGLACHEIANTSDTQKKNEILFESLGGFFGGAAYGAAVTAGILLMATPVGWVGALVIGAGGALTGYAAGRGGRYLYTMSLSHVDFASKTGVSSLCR